MVRLRDTVTFSIWTNALHHSSQYQILQVRHIPSILSHKNSFLMSCVTFMSGIFQSLCLSCNLQATYCCGATYLAIKSAYHWQWRNSSNNFSVIPDDLEQARITTEPEIKLDASSIFTSCLGTPGLPRRQLFHPLVYRQQHTSDVATFDELALRALQNLLVYITHFMFCLQEEMPVYDDSAEQPP